MSGRLSRMVKLCECGCGQPAPISTRTFSTGGYRYVRGTPARFIRGHVSKKNTPPEEPRECACGCGALTTVHRGVARKYLHGHNGEIRRISSDDYSVADRGYETPCWIWKHAIATHGGGQVTVKGAKTTAYRAMYEQEVGPVPGGLVLDHLCEVRPCIRPDHLQTITQGDHMRRHGICGWNRKV